MMSYAALHSRLTQISVAVEAGAGVVPEDRARPAKFQLGH